MGLADVSAAPVRLATEAILTQLAGLGPPSEIRAQAPAIAGRCLGFDRVLLTSVGSGVLEAQALYLASDSRADLMLARLRKTPVTLEYPLIEGEIMRRRRAQLVAGTGGEPRAFGGSLHWSEYVTAPIVLDGRVLGFFHADRQTTGTSLSAHDVAALSSFALCFGLVFERATLRHRVRVQLEEMERFSRWAADRTGQLGDRTISLTEANDSDDRGRGRVRAGGGGEHALRDLLTQRELDVLRLMVRGETNVAIAAELVISPGTVKYHVKNILRKLHASNRAEATSRYLRLTLGHGASERAGPG